jgi:tetratricopeptide (TPR) repeat protein
VSEWEKFYIDSHYYHFVTGDLEKAKQVYELWGQIYPRETVAHSNLGVIYQSLGQYDKALTEFHEAIRINPSDGVNQGNLVTGQLHLNHFDEARASAGEALARQFDTSELHYDLYEVAFLKRDAKGMAEQVTWSSGKPGKENVILYLEAGTAAYAGKVGAARELSRKATTSAVSAGESEMAAGCEAAAALWEALYGNGAEARKRVIGTLAQSNGRDAQYVAAIALALIGDSGGAGALADDLEKRYPKDTIVRFNYLPTLRAQMELNEPNNSEKAVKTLAPALPYELGVPGSGTFWTNLYPVYLRGEAFLAARQGTQAAAEFQKILDWPGVVVNEPIGALARLGLGRAYALAGDSAKSRAAYGEFLTMWKDADPDVPILYEAKREFANLK